MAVRIEGQPVPTAVAPPTPPPAAPAATIRTHAPYLLLADDDRDEASALAKLLHTHSIACDQVHSAEDALRAFMARDYDMLLMNLRGPIQTGLDAAQVIRRLERSFPEPRVPIFILASGATDKDRNFAKNASLDDILERKTDVADLAAIVERTFEVERRTPPDLIQREPLQFAKLLAATGNDASAAMSRAADFARLLDNAITDLKAAIAADDLTASRRVADTIREQAHAYGSDRTRRIATLLTRVSSPGQLKDRGVELQREFEDVARDLAAWSALGLGRVLFQPQAAAATPTAEPAAERKRTTVKVFSFLKNREDVFSKAQ